LTTAIRAPDPKEQVHAFPRHAGTERYLHRNDPLLTPEFAYKFGVLGGGVGAFVSGAIAFYGFLRLRNLKRFESYYREIERIEMLARGLDVDPAAPSEPVALRAYLERRLTTLKCKVVEDFAEGGLKGEGLMAGITALINDTRESLAGLVAVWNGDPEPLAAGHTPSVGADQAGAESGTALADAAQTCDAPAKGRKGRRRNRNPGRSR
jgi:hypothetical protein